MSLVFNSRNAIVGPPLSSPSSYVSGEEGLVGVPSFPVYLNRGNGGGAKMEIHPDEVAAAAESDSCSSIGVASEDEEDDVVGEEVESKFNGSFGSMGSLEDSLPINRGLSNHFSGKSKSFANLSEVSSVKEVEKEENPLNKRRRVMIACKWSKKSSFYGWNNPTSMPLLAFDENEEEEEDNQNDQEAEEEDTTSSKEEEEEEIELQEKRNKQLKGFKSCFSFTDLY